MYDQTIKTDNGKIRPTLVPTEAIRAIAEVREYGVNKYGDSENWKDVEPERYRDALCRHLLDYLDDPTSIDQESGLPHINHILCNAAFLSVLETPETALEKKHREQNIFEQIWRSNQEDLRDANIK